MKIFVKTLKGTNFEIEVKPEDKVSDVKLNIESFQGADIYPAPQQMLIYQGKVLKDTTTLEENKVAENSFIVIMTSKAPPSGSSSASVPAASRPVTAVTPPSSTPSSTTQTPTTNVAPPQPAPVTAPTATAGGNVYGQAASNLVAGTTLESTVQQLLDMGGGSWDRDIVVHALRAAFNNPERAVEYLYSGIPEQAEIPAAAQVPAVGQPSVEPSVHAPEASQIPAGGPNANPLDLFPQGLPILNVGEDFGPASFEVLRQSPQFQALRAMVQANPEILNPMLHELAKQNPALLRLIQNNQAEFLRVINEPMERGEDHPPRPMTVTPVESAAIERLEAMGFNRLTVVQVYFACNKNEELAANYLLDHMHEFEDNP